MIRLDGAQFRDLDHDGLLAPYEDWRNPVDVRIDDLIGRMTLAEKVGQLLHGNAAAVGPLGVAGFGDGYDIDTVRQQVLGSCVTSMISRLGLAPETLAEQNDLCSASLPRVGSASH